MRKLFILLGFILFVASLSCGPKHQVHWESYAPDKIGTAAQVGKPVIVYFYAAWCGPCMKLKYETFSDLRLIQALDPFVRLKADLSFSQSQKSQEIARQHQIHSFPTIILFDRQGNEAVRFSGFMNVEQFLLLLNRHSEVLQT